MQSKITDIQIRHWLKAGRPIAKAQGEVAGLTFTLSAKGTAAWVLRYRLGGVQKEVTIGRYPDFSITDAKTEATKLRQQIQKGTDVARDKRQSQLARAQDQSYKAREMVNCCVSEQVCSGGNLLDVVLYSIPEHHPLDDLSEAGDSVQSAPMAFGTFHQHEHHRQNAVP